MNESKLEKFIKDKQTSDIVYNFIRDCFLKSKGTRDIYILAAERLAVEKLEEAWRELSKFSSQEKESSSTVRQVGL